MRLSVVVPTFNEALHIEDTVSAALCIGDEVIVADGGSADETAELARGAGAHVVTSAKGRGAQLNVGAECAAGDALLFLHADARLPAEARVAIERAYNRVHLGWSVLPGNADVERVVCVHR